MFRNAITPGGHPLFMTKGVQLTTLNPVLVDFDSQYHDLVDLHFKLGAFGYFPAFISSSCQDMISLSFSTLQQVNMSRFVSSNHFSVMGIHLVEKKPHLTSAFEWFLQFVVMDNNNTYHLNPLQ